MDLQSKIGIKKKKNRFFETYLSKILKKISEKSGITSNSKQQLNSIICLIAKNISLTTINLTQIAKKKTLSEKEVSNSIKVIFPEKLSNKIIDFAEKTIKTFENDEKQKGTSRQDKAGIIFPPAQSEKFLRDFGYSKIMVTSFAPIFLACSLEFFTEEILKESVLSAKNNKRIRITIRDLEMGVRNNKDLNSLFIKENMSFLGGGVKPYIHVSLLKKHKKKQKKQEQKEGDKKKHRFRPGTVSLREIKKYQKLSNCLTYAKFPFEKIVRKIVKEKLKEDNTMKISKEVFTILQYYVEQKLIGILKQANFAAIHAGKS